MTSIAHSVLVLGTTLLSLSILFFGGYVINLLSQKNAIKGRKMLNYRINCFSLFERATIAGAITALYVVLMISSFILMSWGSLR